VLRPIKREKLGTSRRSGSTRIHPFGYRAAMSIRATIMNAATGAQIQRHAFGRVPFVGTAFHLESGERVTAQRVDVGKPAPGKFTTPG
jgi:hypothetical protein